MTKTWFRTGVSALALGAVLSASQPAAAGWAPPPAAAAGKPARGVADKLAEQIRRGLLHLAVAFTRVGCDILVDRVLQAQTAPSRIGWGTGTNAAAVTDTDLQTESAETLSGGRVSGTESQQTTDQTGDTYRLTGTVTATGTRAITEYGQFDANSSGATVPNGTGRLLLRGVFSAVNLVSGDSIAFTANLKLVASVT